MGLVQWIKNVFSERIKWLLSRLGVIQYGKINEEETEFISSDEGQSPQKIRLQITNTNKKFSLNKASYATFQKS